MPPTVDAVALLDIGHTVLCISCISYISHTEHPLWPQLLVRVGAVAMVCDECGHGM